MNPAEAPLDIEFLTRIEKKYAFVRGRVGNPKYIREWLIYRMAKKLLYYELQELASMPRKEPGFAAKLEEKRKGK